MSFESLLWKVPNDFTQKYDYPDIYFLASYLRNEKEMISQIDQTILALEKGYKNYESTFSSVSSKRNPEFEGTSENSLFKSFVDSHNSICTKFAEISRKFSEIRTKKSTPLIEKFNNSLKMIMSELSGLKSIISDSYDQVHQNRKAYEQSYAKIHQLAVSYSQNKINPNVQSQQILKLFTSVDNKLKRLQNSYFDFRSKFLDYCQKRDKVFYQSDQLLHIAADEIQKVMNEAIKVDKDIVSALTDYNEPNLEADLAKIIEFALWKKTPQPKKKEKFIVTVDRNIEIDEGFTITPDNEYEVVDASGDDWEIVDKNKRKCRIPLEFIVPLNK